MIQVAMWAVGEYADLLNVGLTVNDNEDNESLDFTEDDVIDKCEQILNTNSMTIVTKEYTIGALIKLSVRFPNTAERVKSLVDIYGCDHSVELQQRAVEFSTLFTKHNYLRPSVLERMPPMTVRAEKRNGVSNGETIEDDINNDVAVNHIVTKPHNQTNSSALLDLLDVSLSPVKTNDNMKNVISESTANDLGDVLDLLGGIDLNPPLNSTPQTINTLFNNSVNESQNTNNLFDIFPNEDKPIQQINNSIIPPIIAFDKNGLKLEFSFERSLENPTLTIISLTATNSSPYPIEEFLFQAAVPKVLNLIILN